MNEFLMALGGGCIGAAVAILAHKKALNNYFHLVEALWNHDIKRINVRIDDLMLERLKNNVVLLSTKSVEKSVNK